MIVNLAQLAFKKFTGVFKHHFLTLFIRHIQLTLLKAETEDIKLIRSRYATLQLVMGHCKLPVNFLLLKMSQFILHY